MSYCRWSDEDFGCDVYVYGSGDQEWTINVGRNRYVADTPIPEMPPLVAHMTPEQWSQWHAADNAQRAWIEAARREPIGLPEDGEQILTASAGACADELERLRALGYRVPQYAIDELREEQASDDAEDQAKTG